MLYFRRWEMERGIDRLQPVNHSANRKDDYSMKKWETDALNGIINAGDAITNHIDQAREEITNGETDGLQVSLTEIESLTVIMQALANATLQLKSNKADAATLKENAELLADEMEEIADI